MSVYTRSSRATRERFWTLERIDKLQEWSRKPMSPLAECVTAAVAGTIMFLVFLFAGLSI